MGSMKTCDLCDSTENLQPLVDPWGGVFGYLCEPCNDRKAQEQAESGPSPSLRDELIRLAAAERRHFGIRGKGP